MKPQQQFEIIYTRVLASHLAAIERKYHSLIRSTIEDQLSYEPEVKTLNRKPLRPYSQLGARNEFRVFYETNSATYEVYILAIGIKIGNQLFIAGEKIEL